MQTIKQTFLAIVLTGFIFVSCNDDDDADMTPQVGNIVETAAEAGSFDILIQAATRAGLANFLSTQSPITVFAPTDQAFANLLKELELERLDQIDNATLTSILEYHVVNGAVYAKDLSNGPVATVNDGGPGSKDLSVLVNVDNGVTINSSKVTQDDVMASNGVIHIVDKVLMPPTVVDIAVTADFSTLVAAVAKAELVETLNGDGPFTVFAPTNEAFDMLFTQLKVSGVDEISKEDLKTILTYHVVSGNKQSGDLSPGNEETVNGESIAITTEGGVMINEMANVAIKDIQGTNGVVHVIDKVLVPESMKSNTIADIAIATPDFSILVDALTKAELVDAVADPDAMLTVFAPTDVAFNALFADLKVSGVADLTKEQLEEILLYHVMGSKIMSADITPGYFPTLSTYSDNHMSVLITTEDGVYLNGDVMVTNEDVEADNGVIHIINKVILPPTVVDIAIDNPDFSILVEAVKKAELVEKLSEEGPFTVFAPNNAAFNKLFKDLEISGITDLTKEQLVPILTYHVVPGNVLEANVNTGIVPTLNDENSIDVLVDNGVVTIDGSAKVIATDVQGKNGVVHVIDKVLVP